MRVCVRVFVCACSYVYGICVYHVHMLVYLCGMCVHVQMCVHASIVYVGGIYVCMCICDICMCVWYVCSIYVFIFTCMCVSCVVYMYVSGMWLMCVCGICMYVWYVCMYVHVHVCLWYKCLCVYVCGICEGVWFMYVFVSVYGG